MTLLLAALSLSSPALFQTPNQQGTGQTVGNPAQKPVQTPPGQTPPSQTPPGQTTPAQAVPGSGTTVGPQATNNFSVYGLTVQDVNGNNVSLAQYQGKALIIVNTASYSVYANQLRDLSSLYQADSGRIAVLGFPSNDFNHETGSNLLQTAQRYQSLGVTFPMFGLTHVTGPSISPLYQFLIQHCPTPNMPIEGDFVKFVTDHQGRIIARLKPNEGPLSRNFQLAVQGIR